MFWKRWIHVGSKTQSIKSKIAEENRQAARLSSIRFQRVPGLVLFGKIHTAIHQTRLDNKTLNPVV